MNFFMMQSLGKYTKTMEMQLKWQHKKKNNDFTADGSTKLNDPTARQAEAIRQAQADGSSKLSSQIRTKLATGKRLTQEEMDYLRTHDPQTYQKAKSLEEERKSYEDALDRCETKEDVERLKMNRTAAALSVVNSVKSNPAIPESAKLGIIWQELQKNKALEETINKFVESGKYAQLPTEAEKMEAEKALQEAKDAEPGIEDSAETPEAKDTDGNPNPTAPAEGDPVDEQAAQALIQETAQKSRMILQERRTSIEEAETTPEALKVKRAKVQAAYRKNQSELPKQVMDLKIK